MAELINLDNKFSQFTEHWRPKVIASLNGQEVKVVKIKGVFPWHVHDKEDEMFMVWKGNFRVEFKEPNGEIKIVKLGPGEMVVVPHGKEHRTGADEEAEVLIFEPAEVRNTGNVVDETYTAPNNVRI
eukprot:Phypoly_transcript_24285.p1 GENE.Phypoly_transcript_24285~~Phypoly_transcript_24285.p1  ORF type:complete len:127 (+),score=19.01 Phypoly_transcript_24285:158-538(+)